MSDVRGPGAPVPERSVSEAASGPEAGPIREAGRAAALDLLRACVTPAGFVASPVGDRNYRRVWARDGVVSGLAGLVADDARLATALRATLTTLAAAQGPNGQIPSNVRTGGDGRMEDVSYGGVCGRVDAIPWFVIGVYSYARQTGDRAFTERMAGPVRRALDLLRAWEFNDRGLVYVPQGGDWADEYVLHGYVLYDQLLRLWALRCRANAAGDAVAAERERALATTLRATFWPRAGGDADAAYHPHAYRRHLEAHDEAGHWLASLAPGGYSPRFDAWANALCVLLGLGDDEQREGVLRSGRTLAEARPHGLVPAFAPPITEADPEWALLRANYRDRFSNAPHRYHNGGLWPVVNGWWGLALVAAGRTDEAAGLLGRTLAACRGEPDDGPWPFPEFLDGATGEPGGSPRLAWSAAGAILLDGALAGRHLHPITRT